MTESPDPDTLRDPRDAAAYWFARVRSGRMDAAQQQRFEAWRQADPAHEREYQRACGLWNGFALVDPARLRALAAEPVPPSGRGSRLRRPLVVGLGLACAVVVAGVALPQWFMGTPAFSQQYATQPGQRMQAALPDASVVDLNTATRLSVRLFEDRRVVELQAGEATFTVTPDPQRPFYVETGATTVRVTGTRFNVRRDGEQVRVAVDSGTVAVQSGHWWNRSQVLLTGGQGTRTLAQGGLSPMEKVAVSDLLAWHAGRVVFRDQALADAVAEMNRYGRMDMRVADAAVGRIHISGVFSVDNPQAFLDLLPAIAPVRVQTAGNGVATIQAR